MHASQGYNRNTTKEKYQPQTKAIENNPIDAIDSQV